MLKTEEKQAVNSKGRSEWEALILEWVHDEIDRTILREHLLNGLTFEQLEPVVELSSVSIKTRYKSAKKQLFGHAGY